MNIPKLFTRLITAEDIKTNFGYDLTIMANQGHFATNEEAVNAWLDEAAESINGLILEKRGPSFTRALNNYISKEENNQDELTYAMFWAQMYEMRFFIDNGRFDSTGKIDPTRKKHDEQAINILYSYSILKDGVM